MAPRLIALYKVCTGEEWIGASLESIYSSVEKIIIVNASHDWLGRRVNTITPTLTRWIAENDAGKKIFIINALSPVSQEEQYRLGMEQVAMIPHDWVMLVDADEVWDEENLRRALDILSSAPPEVRAYEVGMWTYIKSALYRVTPQEPCMPVTFIRSGVPLGAGPRACLTQGRKKMQGVKFHHFTYVRRNEETVFEKIRTSEKGDGTPSLDMEIWKKEKWEKMPNVTNFHTAAPFAGFWKGLEVIAPSDLPPALRLHTLVMRETGLTRYVLLQDAEIEKHRQNGIIVTPWCRYTRTSGTLDGLVNFIRDTHPVKGGTIAEIGCFGGEATEIFAQFFSSVLAVDPWEKVFHGLKDGDMGPEDIFDLRMKSRTNVEKRKLPSVEASAHILDESLDMIYVDALHDYDHVKEDFLAWTPKVKRGGIMAGHDWVDIGCPGQYEGLRKAVIELYGCPPVIYPDGTFYFVKGRDFP